MAGLLVAGCRGADAVPPLVEDRALAAELQAEAARTNDARERRKALEAMTLADAAKLEAILIETPDDIGTRGRLLAFYRVMGPKLQSREANIVAIRRHVAWVTEHHPDSILLTTPVRRADDPVGYAQIRELWMPHIEKRNASLAVLSLASVFFNDEPRIAEGLLLRMQQLPEAPAEAGSIHDRSIMPVWGRLGGLYAQVIQSAGRPGSNVDAAYADEVKARLASSPDAPLLASVAQSLAGPGFGTTDQEVRLLAREYLQRARSIGSDHPHVGYVWANIQRSSAWQSVLVNRQNRLPASYAGLADRNSQLACLAEVEYRTPRGAGNDAQLSSARALAEEALAVAPSLSPEASYCDPMFSANLVLAGIAWREGNRQEAARFMGAASKAPAPPIPGIRGFPTAIEGKLTNSLLKHGERESVAGYLEEASKSRTPSDRTRMLEEAKAIREGRMPARYQRLLSMGHI